MLIDAGPGPVEPERIETAAARLVPGGVLAVLTISHRDAGRLHDPRPALVTAATAAGLDYLQHIVTITGHPHPEPHPGPRPAAGSAAGYSTGSAASWGLGPDVSLFRRPIPDPVPLAETGADTPSRRDRDETGGQP